MSKELEPYKILVDFLADYLGDDTEVVLHDMTDWHCSVIAIRNGHISGRKVGAPITDLALEMVKHEAYKDKPYRVNYKGGKGKGDRIRSATYFIKDSDDELIGMLCINMDCQKLMEARNVLNTMISLPSVEEVSDEPEEIFNIDVRDLVANNVDRVLPGKTDFKKMGKQEKIELVEKLNAMGTFMVKGTIWEVANLLEVSVPTIYRYLAIIKKGNESA